MFSIFSFKSVQINFVAAAVLSLAPFVSAAAQTAAGDTPDTTGNGTTSPPNITPGSANYGNNTTPTAGPINPNGESLPPAAASFGSAYNGMTFITPSTTTGAPATTTPYTPGPQPTLPAGTAPPNQSPYSTAPYGVGFASTSWTSSAPIPSGYYDLSEISPYPNPDSGTVVPTPGNDWPTPVPYTLYPSGSTGVAGAAAAGVAAGTGTAGGAAAGSAAGSTPGLTNSAGSGAAN